MLVFKVFTIIIISYIVHECAGTPIIENTHEISEGRGFMSTIWGWISYPFTWWSSGEEQPITEQLIASSTSGPTDRTEIKTHNVTIWCNDQTCTTMKCNKSECKNVTCNLYDTDLRGECREYNIIDTSEEYTVPPTTNIALDFNTNIDTTVKTSDVTAIKVEDNITMTPEEHPLELEAVISSTVQEQYNMEKQTQSND